MTASYRRDDDVAVITIENPPVNGLSFAVRRDIAAGLQRAGGDPAVRAIVLRGNERGFSGGADIREFGSAEGLMAPNVWSLIDAVERSPKPVVAAIHSVCMGGGFELALGCHYRVVAPGCAVAFPEITLGILPGAGGTQRLPRVLDVESALNVMLSGKTVPSEAMYAMPGQKVFDLLTASKESMESEAIDFARAVAAQRAPGAHPRIRDLECGYPNHEGWFQFVRNMSAPASKHLVAPAMCIDAVEAATMLPFDAGLAVERKLFLQLLETSQFRALRHAFLAERTAARIPDIPSSTPVRKIERVAVIGGGTMGSGITTCLLNAGMPVTLLETGQESLSRATETIRRGYESQVKKRRIKAADLDRRMNLLRPTLQYGDLADSDLVIEAVFESMPVKEAVFRNLDAVLKRGAILASNTSTMDLNAIAAFTSRPQDVVGLHFFSPAPVMKLLEIVRGEKTAPDVLATALALARRIRKTPVVARVADGFIGNRLVEEFGRQAGFLLEEGASPQQVDAAMVSFGMAMGPFAVGDLAGNDIGWAIRRRREVDRPKMIYSKVGDRLHEMGRHGQKSGAGWYDYAPGDRTARPSAAVAAMLDEHRRSIGIAPRSISDQEIVERLVYALVNEGARAVEDGTAMRASDVDIVYLTGYGFPAWRGGPMHYANEVGLYNVADTMRRLQATARVAPDFWQPAPLLERLVAENRNFV
jgi:3-hydroxyacyl-CoA dehydrogenase